MFIGVARFVLEIPGSRSLKDRRRVAKSFKDRMRAKLPVSVAEVGDVEAHRIATFGVATVSNEAARCQEILSHASSMAGTLASAVLADVRTEIVAFGDGGTGIRHGIERLLEEDP